MTPILSILIPSTPDRRKDLAKLLECINEQEYTRHVSTYDIGQMTVSKYRDVLCPIEIIVLEDEKIMTIGEKREMLYKHAIGTHSIQVDSDDLLAPNAIQLILEAIKGNPDVDVISFEEYVSIDGKEFKSNHCNSYADWRGDGNVVLEDGFHFQRTIFFKDVIRTELAKSVPVPRLRWSEDYEWAKLLKPLIQSERHISEQLYRYIHVSSNPEERYGLNK